MRKIIFILVFVVVNYSFSKEVEEDITPILKDNPVYSRYGVTVGVDFTTYGNVAITFDMESPVNNNLSIVNHFDWQGFNISIPADSPIKLNKDISFSYEVMARNFINSRGFFIDAGLGVENHSLPKENITFSLNALCAIGTYITLSEVVELVVISYFKLYFMEKNALPNFNNRLLLNSFGARFSLGFQL